MSKLTIYEIAELTQETSPQFFSKKTMRFFGQTMSKFKVYYGDDFGYPDKYLISCPMKSPSTGKIVGYTERIFNPENNKLETYHKII